MCWKIPNQHIDQNEVCPGECLHLQEMAHMEAWLREMPHVAKESEKQTSNQKERWEEDGKGESGG